jgi:hypothetical protein
MLSGKEQNRTPATTHIQDPFIAAKIQLVEQFSPNQELTSERGVQGDRCNTHHEKDWH